VSQSPPVKIRAAKLLLDKALAGLLLVPLAPALALVALAVKLDGLFKGGHRGPVFYRETRISQGREFGLLKFRILRLPAIERIKDGAVPKDVENQPANLTSVGRPLKKYGLDELPQILNVLKGDLSFVGPRPKPVAEYLAELRRGIDNRRLIRAGLTGPAQIMKGTERTPADEISADAAYIRSCRTLPARRLVPLDLRIIFKTVKVMAGGSGE
jgi:lipopolysaccharide/colanic/teichoic acid biosynthesis glycosyltransferase